MLFKKPIQFLLFSAMGLFNILSLTGCGGESHSAGTAGVFVDSSTENFLKTTFDETKKCTQFSEGNFDELSITLMPPNFPCKFYESGCSGEYLEPNHIKVGSHYIWRHEVIHYLLKLNTGDPDPSHLSPFFISCA
ncbi:MAG TPA: hypothetical protein VGB26_02150 [Nitrospiria bacterium]